MLSEEKNYPIVKVFIVKEENPCLKRVNRKTTTTIENSNIKIRTPY
jgi:hypothetical protein